MKKGLIFVIPMVIVAILLFMLRTTGMKVHIVVSVVGLAVLVAYTIATKKEWKCLSFEILERVFYAIALITGVELIHVHGVVAISIVHKVSAALFVILLIVNEIYKMKKR